MTRPTLQPDQPNDHETNALEDPLYFPLVNALFGRRSRRFLLGADLPDGPLAYHSRYEALPLSDLERLLILSAVAGKTRWHNGITRHQRYAPKLSNYPAAAAGRTFLLLDFIPLKCFSPTTAAPIYSAPVTCRP